MSWLSSSSDAVSCPHCGASLRKGMLRCRECGGAAEDDFQLAEHVQAEAYTPRCEKCGSQLGDDDEECARCASAMLDELLTSGPSEPVPQPGGRRSQQMDFLQASGSTESRLRPAPISSPAGRSSASSSDERASEPRKEKPQRAVAGRNRRSASDGDLPVQRKGKPSRVSRRDAEDEALDYLEAPPEPESDRKPVRPVISDAEVDTTPESSSVSSPDAASQASAALILSLSSTDANLRCQAATALGQLGVPDSIPALEPLMADPEIRVRRAVAESLIQLGHPKGEALRGIADRKPVVAKEPPRPRASKSARSLSLPRFSLPSFDHESLMSTGGPIAGVVLVLGGIFLWHSGILFGPRLDESYRPIKPFYAFWMEDPAPPPVAQKKPVDEGPEMNF